MKIGYSHKSWVLPGGGVDKGETTEKAAVREVMEEAGVVLNNLQYVTGGESNRQYKRVKLHYYYGEARDEDLVIDDQEIVDAGWFALDDLPEKRRQVLDDELGLYKKWTYETKRN